MPVHNFDAQLIKDTNELVRRFYDPHDIVRINLDRYSKLPRINLNLIPYKASSGISRPLRVYLKTLADITNNQSQYFSLSKRPTYEAVSSYLESFFREGDKYRQITAAEAKLTRELFTPTEHQAIEQANRLPEAQRIQAIGKILDAKEPKTEATQSEPKQRFISKETKEATSREEKERSRLSRANYMSQEVELPARQREVGFSLPATSRSLMLNPMFWVAGFFIFIIVFGILLGGIRNTALFPPYEQSFTSSTSGQSASLSFDLKGPGGCTNCQVGNGEAITYQASVVYKPQNGEADIEISGSIPPQLELRGFEASGSSFTQLLTGIKSGQAKTVNITFTPKIGIVDFEIKDYSLTAKIIKTTGTPPATRVSPSNLGTGQEAANSNTCGGKYTTGLYPIQSNPLGQNFGDPLCNFTNDRLLALLKEVDPQEAAFWFWLVEHESSYIPNAYTGYSPAKGAWGLFQMGTGVGRIYDKGDVAWQLQTTNAVNLKNELKSKGYGFRSKDSYWEPATPGYCQRFPNKCRNRP